MDLLLGLPNLKITGVAETLQLTTCTISQTGRKPKCPCPECRLGTRHIRAHGFVRTKVWDTPIRAKPCRLIIERRRYRCKCGNTFCAPHSLGIDSTHISLTARLVRYIQNEAFRRTTVDIARETGVKPPVVSKIAQALASRLHEHHRFPTPVVLGIDDLHIRKKLYTVITDGRTGRPIGLVDGMTETAISTEIARRMIDPSKVQFVVSDLGTSNIAVVKRHFSHAIHVADKWHVLKGAKEALYRVINKQIDATRRWRAGWVKWLKSRGHKVDAASLKSIKLRGRAHPLRRMQDRIDKLNGEKPILAGARVLRRPNNQLELDLDYEKILPVCQRYPKIGRAFWARMRIHMVYTRDNRAEASAQLVSFVRRASSKKIRAEMLPLIKRVIKHRHLILNYYDALQPGANGQIKGLSNGPTEQRNSRIKAAWKLSRGIKKHEMFSMRALYDPWKLDVDIGVCSFPECTTVEGPFPDRARRLGLPLASGYQHLCADHAI